MSALLKKTTVYFDPEIHHALRMMAEKTHSTISALVNEAVRIALQEDQDDLRAFEERAAETTL